MRVGELPLELQPKAVCGLLQQGEIQRNSAATAFTTGEVSRVIAATEKKSQSRSGRPRGTPTGPADLNRLAFAASAPAASLRDQDAEFEAPASNSGGHRRDITGNWARRRARGGFGQASQQPASTQRCRLVRPPLRETPLNNSQTRYTRALPATKAPPLLSHRRSGRVQEDRKTGNSPKTRRHSSRLRRHSWAHAGAARFGRLDGSAQRPIASSGGFSDGACDLDASAIHPRRGLAGVAPPHPVSSRVLCGQ
jgi:hypothetical protein